MNGLIDIGLNLMHKSFDKNREEIIENANAVGVSQFVITGTNILSSETAMNYAKTIGAKYYETSALTDENKNCKVVFQQCAHLIVSKFNSEVKGKSCPCSIY